MNRLIEEQGVDGLLSKLSRQAGDHRAAMVAGENATQTRARLLAGLRHQVEGFESLLEALEPRLIERVECDGYTRERVELGVLGGLPFSAYVLIPHALRPFDRLRTGQAP